MSHNGTLGASCQLLENEVTRLTRELTRELLSSGPRKALVADALCQLEKVLADLALLEAGWGHFRDEAQTALDELKQVTRISRGFSMDLADLANQLDVKVTTRLNLPVQTLPLPLRH